MLTPEKEKERAIEISRLYNRENKIVITDESSKISPFPTYSVWKFSFILLLPIVVIYALVNLFLGLHYNSISDIQGASIALIGVLIIMGIVLFRTLGDYRQNMKSILSNESFFFWLIILFLPPLILLVRVSFGLNLINSASLLILKLSLSTLLILIFSSLYILLLAYILEKNNLNRRYLIALFLAILPGLAYAIVS